MYNIIGYNLSEHEFFDFKIYDDDALIIELKALLQYEHLELISIQKVIN